MKSKGLLALAMAVLLPASAVMAAIDMDKWNAFVKEELSNVSKQVKKSGRAPVSRPFVGDYDLNKDNYIDEREVKAINTFLSAN